jgi:mRNA-degrading endonuclease YafQ of YafQ-DinJ toxin-antitoxin module
MKIKTTRRFDKDYTRLPREIKNLLDKKLRLFFENQNHPSLRVKKMEGHPNIWEASITMQYRFTFEVHSDFCILRRVGTHDILNIP